MPGLREAKWPFGFVLDRGEPHRCRSSLTCCAHADHRHVEPLMKLDR